MAKQLGDQGSLSKNLQEKEGVGYRKARPGLGFSDSSPPKLDSGSERLLGSLVDGKLTSRAGITKDVHSLFFLVPWVHRLLLFTWASSLARAQIRDNTQALLFLGCT